MSRMAWKSELREASGGPADPGRLWGAKPTSKLLFQRRAHPSPLEEDSAAEAGQGRGEDGAGGQARGGSRERASAAAQGRIRQGDGGRPCRRPTAPQPPVLREECSGRWAEDRAQEPQSSTLDYCQGAKGQQLAQAGQPSHGAHPASKSPPGRPPTLPCPHSRPPGFWRPRSGAKSLEPLPLACPPAPPSVLSSRPEAASMDPFDGAQVESQSHGWWLHRPAARASRGTLPTPTLTQAVHMGPPAPGKLVPQPMSWQADSELLCQEEWAALTADRLLQEERA